MKIKSNFMLRLASFLFICVIASTVVLSGLLARYVTSGSGNDDARVIKFGDLSINETTNKYVICPGVPLNKDAKVSFTGSEAATYIFVKMDLSSHWEPNDTKTSFNYASNVAGDAPFMSFSINDKWTYVNTTDYVYYMLLEPNETISDQEVLDNSNIDVSSRITMKDLKTLVGDNEINIDFTARVVQANGFDSVDEAWESVKNK